MSENVKVVATNRKAGFEYFLFEKFEAGLVLNGSEIKSIRAGQISIQESYVDIEAGKQAWLVESHIAPYEQANRFNHDPKRRRKLLLHKKQIRELWNIYQHQGHDRCAHSGLSEGWTSQDRNRPCERQESL